MQDKWETSSAEVIRDGWERCSNKAMQDKCETSSAEVIRDDGILFLTTTSSTSLSGILLETGVGVGALVKNESKLCCPALGAPLFFFISLNFVILIEIGAVPLSLGGPRPKMEKNAVSDFDSEVICPSIPRILSY